MKNLIGRKVKGFKFDGEEYSQTGYYDFMDDYVDKIGIIQKVFSDYSYLVDFGDDSFCYPAELIEQHLIN